MHPTRTEPGQTAARRPRAWRAGPPVVVLALALVAGACTATGEPPAPATDAPESPAATAAAAGPVEARLAVRARPHEPHWIEADAGASVAPGGQIDHFSYWVTDAAGATVRAPRNTGSPLHGFALGPGAYEVHVRVVAGGGAEATASQAVQVSAEDVVVTEKGTPCSIGADGVFSCTMAHGTGRSQQALSRPGVGRLLGQLLRPLAADRAYAMSAAGSSSNEVEDVTSGSTENLQTLLQSYQNLLGGQSGLGSVSDTDPVWIEAFGASGGDGAKSLGQHGGNAGSGGQALTVTSVSQFSAAYGTDSVIYYLGENGHHNTNRGGGGDGGASTIVRVGDGGSGTTLEALLLVIAGGGGGAGSAGPDGDGWDGGTGGCALATAAGGSAVTGAGGDGHGKHNGHGGNGATGGTKDGAKVCGADPNDANSPPAHDGAGGFGGTGGKGSESSRAWSNASPGDASSVDKTLASDGAGGQSDWCGGAGGGGYGGGGGATNNGGGGGGGSYAIGALVSDSTAPTSCGTSGSADGLVRITFSPGG